MKNLLQNREQIIIATVVVLFFVTALVSIHMPNAFGRYIDRAKKGADQILLHQSDEFVHYQYNPFTNEHAELTSAIHEMETMYLVARLGNFFNDQQYKEFAGRGYEYYEQFFKYDANQDISFVNVTPQRIKLGYNPFVILTALNLDQSRTEDQLEELDRFARGILSLQNDDGSFKTHFYSNKTGGVDFYPGASMYALMRLFHITDNTDYLQAVEMAYPFYRDYFERSPNRQFVVWQTLALNELYATTKKREIAEFILRMNRFLINDQLQDEDDTECRQFEFRDGAYTGAYMQAVASAYSLAQTQGEGEMANCFKNYIEQGADYLQDLQIEATNRFDAKADGGFLMSEEKTEMRIHYTAHAVMGLIRGYTAGLLRN